MASSNTEARKRENEIHDMVSQLTDRLSAFDGGDATFEKGVRIITIAGNNKGATMKKQLALGTAGLMSLENQHYSYENDNDDDDDDDDSTVHAYANSNYQAVNNSVLVGGSCAAEDPGIHIEIVSESLHGDDDEEESEDEHERETKEKEKEKEK